jgi:hypothetical protein
MASPAEDSAPSHIQRYPTLALNLSPAGHTGIQFGGIPGQLEGLDLEDPQQFLPAASIRSHPSKGIQDQPEKSLKGLAEGRAALNPLGKIGTDGEGPQVLPHIGNVLQQVGPIDAKELPLRSLEAMDPNQGEEVQIGSKAPSAPFGPFGHPPKFPHLIAVEGDQPIPLPKILDTKNHGLRAERRHR